MSAPRKIRIGDLLVEQGMISAPQLDSALAEQKGSGKKLGRVLIESGALSEDYTEIPNLDDMIRRLDEAAAAA